MPHSLHSHSGQFCSHAVGSLEHVVLAAIEKGFQIYGLSEHVPRYREEDLYPEERELTLQDLSERFGRYLDEAHSLKIKYASQITLLVGLETEYITDDDLDQLEALLARYGERVEYLVGSVHHVNGLPIDFDAATYRSAVASDHGRFLSRYFDAQYELLRRFKPEVVGHLDLCRLYTPDLRLADFPDALGGARRNILFAIEYGAIFEINAAALRKDWTTPYPGPDLLQIILENGGRLGLSDDSHGPHAVGLNYCKLPAYLRKAGVTELWFLERASTPNSAGRFIRGNKMEEDWETHSLWKQL